MSEENKDSQTEEPTEKKIRDAIEKGNLPLSKEVNTFSGFLALLIILGYFINGPTAKLSIVLARLLDGVGDIRIENEADFIQISSAVGLEMAMFLVVPVSVLLVFGLAATWFQHPPQVSFDRLKPELSKISPGKGFKRMFGAQGGIEFLKALAKFIILAVVIGILLSNERQTLANLMFTDPSLLPEELLSITVRLVSGICVAIITLVALDVIWVRGHWRRNLRMSRKELKDEYKDTEGDPAVKGRMRSLARDRARNRMMASVPKATVVIANPTHYSVAVRYTHNEDKAPLVIAKGQDLIALKIRQIAEDNDIPVIEDIQLARALYAQCEVDTQIPPQFFRVVAELLYYVYTAKDENFKPALRAYE
ncbi:flagellar biosynthesis protein FlhB [Cohaesibacter celericrescens]|uniref:Flagellar biosynthetic protein FlhB n=1 Tax=Cohaesibacter celericrescens TaxID=2067669 RepID=A0A2N5XWU7_9HYPH|nr:flagellar biosynthesis protein FlhB [Cohaesibacter celericrescens]PLW75498.1 flagellar biosynthesis protein FlhB [Cohaesibacter celericrescens]PLW78905.1 flagellar biosynthesis protein FlhB [Cohaesibacter celericrescens]